MIKEEDLIQAGRFNKPHGIKGELSASLMVDADLEEVKCVVIRIDGIFVPFFIESVRPKNAETYLIMLEGIDSEEKSRRLTNQSFWLLKTDVTEEEIDFDEGFYASDLIGFTVVDDTLGEIGEIADVNDLTQNILFIVSSPAGKEILLPVADEFILEVDPETKTVHTSYPTDILQLNH